MSEQNEYRDLGMDRRIDRRDFLNGVAVGVGALSSALHPRPASAATRAQSTQSPAPDAYPPRRIGLRGQHASAVEAFGAIDSGKFSQFPGIDDDTRETYDLVIVGGGLSGLAAAYFWQRALGATQRVLILDNHDDFGGHAKRNEFVYNGRTFLSFGGTMSIATPYPYSYMSKRLVEDLGIDVTKNAEVTSRELFDTYHLGPSTFFDKEHFGEDRLVVGTGRLPWDQFFGKAPLSRGRVQRPDPAVRREPGLHGRDVRRAQDRRAREDQLSGVPAEAREDEPGRAAVLPRAGRPQQQARRHDAGARSGAPRLGRLRRTGPAEGRAVPAGQLHVPLPGRQRLDRAAAGVAPGAEGDSRHARHAHHRQAGGGLRQAGR